MSNTETKDQQRKRNYYKYIDDTL